MQLRLDHETSVRAIVPQQDHGNLVLCGLPGLRIGHDGTGYYDPEYAALTFEYLSEMKVSLLYLLIEEIELPPNAKRLLEGLGLEQDITINWVPIVDYGVPDKVSENLWKTGRSVRLDCLRDGDSIAISCIYGAGRCGMMAAAISAEMGIDAHRAVRYVRKHFEEAVGSLAQERWIAKGTFLS